MENGNGSFQSPEIRQIRDEFRMGRWQNIPVDLERYLRGEGIDNMRELNYYDRKALHNLKYFTWVEQQGRTSEELNRLWDPEFWDEQWEQIPRYDKLIDQFNRRVGLL